MKLVITADVHLHPYRICSKDGGFDRLGDGLSVLRQSLELARRERAVWVMAGDFKQPKTFWPQEALTGSHAIMREFEDVEKIMVAGNHDAEGLGGSGLAPFKDCAKVVEKAGYVSTQNEYLLCAPWNANRAEIRALAKENRGVAPLIAHAFLAGAFLGPEDLRIGGGIPLEEYGDFPVAFFGDIHKGQWRKIMMLRPAMWEPYTVFGAEGLVNFRVRAPERWQGEVFYPGSPYQQSWGERNDGAKGVLLVDIKSGEVQFCPLRAPRFMHFEVDEKTIEGLFEAEAWDELDFVRVVYTGKPSAALDDLRSLAPHARSFQVITRPPKVSQQRTEVHAGMTKSELLQRYMEARPPAENVDRLQALGAGLRLAE